nr:uncharacterized protein LOC112012206 [Quercus suber]
MDAPESPQIEASFLNMDGPPSSPFVTEIEPQSRLLSTTWKPEDDVLMEEESNLTNVLNTPVKPHTKLLDSMLQDKENLPQMEHVRESEGLKASPMKTTPVKSTRHDQNEHRDPGSDDGKGPPPTSTRKAQATPRKTPLVARRNNVNTPNTLNRDHSFDRSSAFQVGLDSRSTMLPPQDDTATSVDDTCFTAFSEIPDMTQFARLGQSPTKSLRTPRAGAGPTPRTSRKRASPSRSPSPTPRRLKTPGAGSDGTTFLIDFTEQIHGLGGQRRSPAKSVTESNLLQYINNQRSPDKGTSRQSLATPSRPNPILNLLDFELPPAPTPRSIPTITVRELESLKSSYLSQISSLKATLSGREAEVESLKRAVGDAERRVGDAQEALREEKCRREHVEEEKAGWEKRGQEVENVLRNVKDEVLKSEAEKETMSQQISDLSARLEEADNRAQKADERFAETLAAHTAGDTTASEDQVQHLVSLQIDAKIEAVSRELHAVYKEKHERKVATLKKSYEARSEKKCHDLTARLAALEKQHDELLAARDATFTGPHAVPAVPAADEQGSTAAWKTELEEQRATIARMAQEMDVSRQQQAQLEHDLQAERIEKGDLVAAVDEMLALQSQSTAPPAALSVVEDFRKSISRPASQLSGLKPPASSSSSSGPGASKIGRGGVPAPSNAGSLGKNAVGKSRMLANIERMGRTGSAPATAGAGTE